MSESEDTAEPKPEAEPPESEGEPPKKPRSPRKPRGGRKRGPGRPRNRGRRASAKKLAPSTALVPATETRLARAKPHEGARKLAAVVEERAPQTELERAEAEINRVLEQDPRLAPKRREVAASISILRLPPRDGERPREIVHACENVVEFVELATSSAGGPEPPRQTIDVIPRERFSELSRAGGLLPFLEENHGPGRYRAIWTSADLHTIDVEELEVADLERLEEERRLAEERKREEEREAQRKAWHEQRRAEKEKRRRRLFEEWAQGVAVGFMVAARKRIGLGAEARELHQIVVEWLLANRLSFVAIVRGDHGNETLAPVQDPRAVFAALRVFLPPRRVS